MSRILTLALGALALAFTSTGCMKDAPDTAPMEWEAGCQGTQPGNACLTLRFSLEEAIREQANGVMGGDLNWALYKRGDVGLLGPGNNAAVLDGKIENADFGPPGSVYELHLPDMPAQPYHILAYLDRDRSGNSSKGDPVTFPSDAFPVSADRRTQVDVRLNYTR